MFSINKNHNGMASILFAMTFVIVLSLLAIGFATLVRNDQREVLDQTLGYQAQYAAEAAVNQVQAAIKEGNITAAQNTCQTLDLGNDIQASCVKWDDVSKDVVFGAIQPGRGSKSFKLATDGTGNLNGLIVKWINETGGPYSEATNKLPYTITSSNKSIIKIAMVKSDGTDFRQFYIVPNTSGTGGNINIVGADGIVYRDVCSAGAECSVQIDGTSGYTNGYFAISVIGQTANSATIEAIGTNFKGAQYTVDATAIANDITKRVEARVNPESSSWRPSAAVSTDKICKDIKVDGTNKASISTGAANSACPLNP